MLRPHAGSKVEESGNFVLAILLPSAKLRVMGAEIKNKTKKETRGRKPLYDKSIRLYATISYDDYEIIKQYVSLVGGTSSSFLREAIENLTPDLKVLIAAVEEAKAGEAAKARKSAASLLLKVACKAEDLKDDLLK